MSDGREERSLPAGDEVVLRLWSELSDSLRAWFVRQTRDEHTADDLLQECFLRVYDRIDGVRDEERLGVWIRQIARNLVIDWRRRGDASSATLDVDEVYDVEQGVEGAPNFDSVVAGWLAPTIDELADSDRETLRLTELESLPQKDAAERLGISLAALKSRVLRGRRRLRERIQACCELEFDRRGGIVAYRERSSNCCNN